MLNINNAKFLNQPPVAAPSSLESFSPHSHLSRSPQKEQTQVQFSIGFLQSSQVVKSSSLVEFMK